VDTFAVGLVCVRCGARYPLVTRAACSACLTGLDVPSIEDSSLSQTLAVEYDVDALRRSVDRDRLRSRPPGLWKWAELLPVAEPASRIDVGAGGTRLAPLSLLERDLPVRLFAKVEGQNPTGSFKDRPIGVAASVAQALGARTLACMTSGNIGSAMAAAAARAGLPAVILLLASGGVSDGLQVNIEKLGQMRAYGATVLCPEASVLTLTRLAADLTRDLGWTWMHDLPAYQAEGDKTTAYEIAEQLGWDPPEWVVVPAGTGTNLFGIWKGFDELRRLGFTNAMPRIAAVQPAGADPMVEALRRGDTVMRPLDAVRPNIALPITHRVTGHHAYRSVRETGGTAVAVSDEEIRRALLDLAGREGIYCEPASAAALAGARKLVETGALAPGSRVVCVLTSHGLKDGRAVGGWFGSPVRVEATLDAVRRAVPPAAS
jgi:threonine synthase